MSLGLMSFSLLFSFATPFFSCPIYQNTPVKFFSTDSLTYNPNEPISFINSDNTFNKFNFVFPFYAFKSTMNSDVYHVYKENPNLSFNYSFDVNLYNLGSTFGEVSDVWVSTYLFCLDNSSTDVNDLSFDSFYFNSYSNNKISKLNLSGAMPSSLSYSGVFNFNILNSQSNILTNNFPYFFGFSIIAETSRGEIVKIPLSSDVRNSVSLSASLGFSSDVSSIFQDGYSTGQDVAYDTGYAEGYESGYDIGIQTGHSSDNIVPSVFNFLSQIWSSISSIFNIKIFGDFTLGSLLSIPLILVVILFVFKIIGI